VRFLTCNTRNVAVRLSPGRLALLRRSHAARGEKGRE
jgi:hypothetical protein